MYKTLFCILVFFSTLISCVSDTHSRESPRKVLVIHSFEPEYIGYQGAQGMDSQIAKAFSQHDIQADIRTFYLDCDTYLAKEEGKRMYQFMDSIAKWKPEIILVDDDQATYSLMACNHPFVKQVPVIFSGVNFPNWDLLKQYPNVTGFWDKPEFLKTVKMIESLFGPMRINFWIDLTFLGKQTTHRLFDELYQAGINKIASYFLHRKEDKTYELVKDSTFVKTENMLTTKPNKTLYNLLYSRESSSNGLLWTLSGLARYSIFVQSKRDFSSQRLGLFANNATFSVVNEGFGLGEGILGGYLTPVETQIQLSVQAAADVLKGKSVTSIPITETPKEYLLDWVDIERWNIEKSKIPANYRIINMPFAERYKGYLITSGLLAGLVIIALIIYLTYLYQRENRNKQEAQKKLKERERFLSLTLAGGKVFAFQLKEHIFYFDSDFYEIAGLEDTPIHMHTFVQYLHLEDRGKFNRDLMKAREEDLQEVISQNRCKFKTSHYEWWEFRYTYTRTEEIFNGLCLNIQQAKEAEMELIEARRKAEESDKMKSAFLANMSHEIRTPLNAIVGFSNIIGGEGIELEAEEKSEFLKLINTNCALLLKLINDILDLSRIESGKMDFVFTPCNLTDLINEIFLTHQLLMPEGVKLQKETPQIPVIIQTDPHRLTQVITNFINNASKFTKAGYIKIGYENNPDPAIISLFVEDTGIGIPAEKQKAIFERFNKLDEFAQGTGLGLAICMVIVQRFNGKIRVESEEGKGSRFIIDLPLRSF